MPRVRILLLVFMGEYKIDLTWKKLNFLFLSCFEIAIIQFIQMRRLVRQTHSFFPSHFCFKFNASSVLTEYDIGSKT